MKCLVLPIAGAVLTFVGSTLHAQVIIGGGGVPQMINYQGRVVVGSTNFDGPGQFKFALVSAGGVDTVTYWSNDGSSAGGSEPVGPVSLAVAKGLYSVLLGDASLANMTAIPTTVFSRNEVYLRVWFNDGTHGSQLLAPDQRIAAVGYAMMAGSVPDGSITSAKLAPNLSISGTLSVGNFDLAPPSGGNPAGAITQGGTSLIHTFESYSFFAGLSAGNSTMQRDYNTAVGSYSFQANTFGADNTALGFSALTSNTTGSDNTATGFDALYGNTTGKDNTVSGSLALDNNTSGSDNTVIGYSALNSNKSAGSNVAIGASALLLQSYDPGVAWDSNNIAVGRFALTSNQPTSTDTGVENIALGTEALFHNTIGAGNIAVGYQAGVALTTGDNNIDIGNPGVAGEGNIIRIGEDGVNTDTYLVGFIHGDGSHLTGITLPATSLTGTISSAQIGAGSVGNAQLASGLTLAGVTTGNDFNLAATTSATAGVITQGGVSLMQTYGTLNFFAGPGAGNFTMTGSGNTATGPSALLANTTGLFNTANGLFALQHNTTGGNNTAIGVGALRANTGGDNNTAVGLAALQDNTTGANNTASGYGALGANLSGDANTASGYSALTGNTTAGQNVAIGNSALASQSFDNGGVAWNSNNVAVGFQALNTNQPTTINNGIDNTAVGTSALAANTTGGDNTASGFNALSANTTGVANTADGALALAANTTGGDNTASGSGALAANTTGSFNAASGFQALSANTTGEFNVAIAHAALLRNTTGRSNTALGDGALSLNTTGSSNVALGDGAGGNLTTGSHNIDVGSAGAAGESNTIRIGQVGNQTATYISGINGANVQGLAVVINSDGQLGAVNIPGAENTASGILALSANTTGSLNTAVAQAALLRNTTGSENTALGDGALSSNTTGSENIALGVGAGSNLTTGNHNIDIDSAGVAAESNTIRIGDVNQTATYIAGIYSANVQGVAVVINSDGQLGAMNIPGAENTALGNSALSSNTTGSFNTAMARDALFKNTAGIENTAIGTEALSSNTTGSENIALGANAGDNLTTGDHNIDIGAFGAAGESNTIRVGTENQTATYISGIYGASVQGVAVVINSDGQLGAMNIPGAFNTALGIDVLSSNTTGSFNTAVAHDALFKNTAGDENTALGEDALSSNTTGSENIALGANAGDNLTTGDHNIDIGAFGAAGESNTIRIGFPGNQAATYIAGIRGVTSVNNDAVGVVIDSNGQLGTISSSRRYKEDIADMGDASARLLTLRPVSFRYRKPYANGEKPVQYGLIAEEVAAAFPELAVRNEEGQPESVKYQDLAPLLLNEFLKEHRRVADLEKQLAELEARDKEREARLTRIEQSFSTAQNVSSTAGGTEGN